MSLIPNHTHKWVLDKDPYASRVRSNIRENCSCGVTRFISEQWWTTDYYFEGRLIKRTRLTQNVRNRITKFIKESMESK